MSELVIACDAYSRWKSAAKNGSVIALAVCRELTKAWLTNTESVFRGHVNYIDGVAINNSRLDHRVRYCVTYCGKDISNPAFPDHDNPRAMYLVRNRTRCDVSTFVAKFKNITECFSSEDYSFLISCLLVGRQIHIQECVTADEIGYAYGCSHYHRWREVDCGSLWNSCMRGSSAMCGAFYAKYAHAHLLMAYIKVGSRKEVIGRTLYWPNVDISIPRDFENNHFPYEKFLDRRYYSFSCVPTITIRYAVEHGTRFMRDLNSYSDPDRVKVISFSVSGHKKDEVVHAQMRVGSDSSSWPMIYHGSPFLDTFSYLTVKGRKDSVIHFANHEDAAAILFFHCTDGTADPVSYEWSKEDIFDACPEVESLGLYSGFINVEDDDEDPYEDDDEDPYEDDDEDPYEDDDEEEAWDECGMIIRSALQNL